jgi:hypothetical protein
MKCPWMRYKAVSIERFPSLLNQMSVLRTDNHLHFICPIYLVVVVCYQFVCFEDAISGVEKKNVNLRSPSVHR